MTRLDDAKNRSSVLSNRIKQRTDIKLQELIAGFEQQLSFNSPDELMISQKAWQYVKASRIKPEQVFAHPDLLYHHPQTSEYYRGIALLSRKRVAAIATPVDTWEKPERKTRVSQDNCKKVARLYNTVISSVIEGTTDWTLDNGYRNIIANMGIALDGSIRNLIGRDAENIVKDRIRDWLDSRGLIIKRNKRGIKFRLPKDYLMYYGSEPDIEFRQNGKVISTIEIKGGTDPAGALERLGAVQKSFEATPPGDVNLLVAGIVTTEMEQRLNSLGIHKYFLLDDITHDGRGWNDFLNEVFHHIVRITDEVVK